MFVKALSLYNFRNYTELLYTPANGLNLLCGENAQGKTNLLESIFLCAFGRSQRTMHDDELILHGSQSCSVKIKVSDSSGINHTIGVTLSPQSKVIEIDGEKIKKIGDLMGVLKVVMFSPESLSLIKGSPQERRRFMDMSISQLSRSYFFKLQKYNSSLKQRNALLKTPDAEKCRDYIRMWDEQLASSGSYIIAARQRFIQSIAPMANEFHKCLSLNRDTFELEYAPSVKCDDESKLQELIMQKLEENFEDDIRRGTTYAGPHKDDINIKTNGFDSRIYASQGQQRTAALALRLSEIELIKSTSDECPVILLDDVFSELDESRCNALLQSVSGCQCILTCAQEFMTDLIEADINIAYCKSGTISV